MLVNIWRTLGEHLVGVGGTLGKFGFTTLGKWSGRPVKGRPVWGGMIFQPAAAYSGKDRQTWLQNLRDYLSGKTADLDRLFDNAEA